MERRKFIKTSCIACIGGIVFSGITQGCGITKTISAPIDGSSLVIPITAFQIRTNKEVRYKKYIVVQNEQIQFPICVYRLSENIYTALYMRCTHQGAELQVFGNKLQCPAHGSEFSNTGQVSGTPATENLRTFPVTIFKDHITLSLTK